MKIFVGLAVASILAGAAHAEDQIITLTSENDAYTRTSDGNYTNGMRASWLDADNRLPRWLEVVTEKVPFFNAASSTIPLYSLGQNIYTPSNITPFTSQPNDRPYAGYTYGSVGLTNGDLNRLDDLELTAGWVGPSAAGKAVQKRYHEVINVQKPNGWAHQLKNEPALGVSWQRRYPRRLAVPVGNGLISTMPYAGVTLGNVHTNANVGAILSYRTDATMITDTPMRVAPGIPGTGFFSTAPRLNAMVFAGVEGRAVARNIFLDGNTFVNSPSVRKRNGVADVSVGVMLTYKRYQVGYTTVYRTPEFFGPQGGTGNGQYFGALSAGMKF